VKYENNLKSMFSIQLSGCHLKVGILDKEAISLPPTMLTLDDSEKGITQLFPLEFWGIFHNDGLSLLYL
jgi:hypothetical protein